MIGRTYLEKLEIDNMILDEVKKEGNKEKIQKIQNMIAEHKRQYRKCLKRTERAEGYLYPGRDGNGYGKIVNSGGDWDYFWRKIFFEGEEWNEEEKREFIEDNWIEIRSAYDCTGKVFTRAIDVFNVPTGVVAYIRYAVDV